MLSWMEILCTSGLTYKSNTRYEQITTQQLLFKMSLLGSGENDTIESVGDKKNGDRPWPITE
jgi:hypothetical protein